MKYLYDNQTKIQIKKTKSDRIKAQMLTNILELDEQGKNPSEIGKILNIPCVRVEQYLATMCKLTTRIETQLSW